MKNAVRVADSFSRNRMIEQIGSALAQLDEHIPDLDGGSILGTMLGNEKEFRVGARKKRDTDRSVDESAGAEAVDEPERG